MEFNDIYDENRNLTGRTHRRGSNWKPGEYGLVVCVWVYDGKGNLLLTRRAKGKSFAGTWENSGGAAKAGEGSRQAITRELFEETGIKAHPDEFEFIGDLSSLPPNCVKSTEFAILIPDDFKRGFLSLLSLLIVGVIETLFGLLRMTFVPDGVWGSMRGE